jgi:hypothetical protein
MSKPLDLEITSDGKRLPLGSKVPSLENGMAGYIINRHTVAQALGYLAAGKPKRFIKDRKAWLEAKRNAGIASGEARRAKARACKQSIVE